MLIKLNIDNDAFSRINELVQEGKYPDLHRFIEIAINNQIEEEISEGKVSSVPFEFERETQRVAAEHAESEAYRIRSLSADGWQKKLKEIKLEESEIIPKKEDMIWSFYNRFLPVKIVIRQLAHLMVEHQAWIELSQLQDLAYGFATEICYRLRTFEDDLEVSRNQRLSTGLPTPVSELKGLKGAQKRKKELKLLSSKTRFMEQFVGRRNKKENQFYGAGFSMGLMTVKFDNGTTLISLTEKGREFALFNNPIIDGQQKDVSFYNDEVNFIMENIIPRFQLENTIVNKIFNELKRRSLTSDDIDEIFKNEKEQYFKVQKSKSTKEIEDALRENKTVQERVATMGRLSEIGLVKWVIDNKGYSTYLLNKTL